MARTDDPKNKTRAARAANEAPPASATAAAPIVTTAAPAPSALTNLAPQTSAASSPRADTGSNSVPPDGAPWFARMLFQGWVSIAVWMIFGLLLEGLLGYKTPGYLQDDERRELFRLAHTHGTFLGLLLVAAALCGQRFSAPPPRAARVALRWGTILMPVGFLLAGAWHYESDPGLAIWLVPPAALLVVFGAITFALVSRNKLRADE